MLISISEYAKKRNATYQAVYSAVKTGRISLVDGKVDPDIADIEWEANRRRAPNVVDTTVNQETDDGVPSLEASRRRREFHEANLAEMREQQKAGQLVELAKVHLAYTTLAAQLRAALERIPDKLAPRLAAECDEPAVHRLLTLEVDQALADMAARAQQLPSQLTEASRAD